MEYRPKVFILTFDRRAFQAEIKQVQRHKYKSVLGTFVKQQGDHCGWSRSSEGKNGVRSEK